MKDQLSALMDGELSDEEVSRLVKSMKSDAALRETWSTYHLLGDTLRKSPQLSPAFNTRLAQRLASEATVLAPQRQREPSVARRFPMTIAASIAAFGLVGIVGFQLASLNQSAPPIQVATAPVAQPQLAQAAPVLPKADIGAVAVVNLPVRTKLSSPPPSNYLLAHQEFSPSYAPAYVRVVSEHIGYKR